MWVRTPLLTGQPENSTLGTVANSYHTLILPHVKAPQHGRVLAEDLEPIRRGEERNFFLDDRQLLLERRSLGLGAGGAGEAGAPQEPVGAECVVDFLHDRIGVAKRVL